MRKTKIQERVWSNYEKGKYDKLLEEWRDAVNDIVDLAKKIRDEVGGEEFAEALMPCIAEALSNAYADAFEFTLNIAKIWEEIEDSEEEEINEC